MPSTGADSGATATSLQLPASHSAQLWPTGPKRGRGSHSPGQDRRHLGCDATGHCTTISRTETGKSLDGPARTLGLAASPPVVKALPVLIGASMPLFRNGGVSEFRSNVGRR